MMYIRPSSAFFGIVTVLLAAQAFAFVPAPQQATSTSLNFNMRGQMSTEQGQIAGIGGMAGPSAPSPRPQKIASKKGGVASAPAATPSKPAPKAGGLGGFFNRK